MENHFIATYTKNDPIVQDKIRQLFEAFERITQLELELEEFKSKFGAWFKDLATDVWWTSRQTADAGRINFSIVISRIGYEDTVMSIRADFILCRA